MAVTYEEIIWKDYGKCMRISNDTVSLIVSLDFGPRVLFYSFKDGENMFYEDRENKYKEDSPALKDMFGSDAIWKIYGGHRMWFACEDVSTYCPDNDPVTYEYTEKGIKFIQKEMPVLHFIRSIEIILEESGSKVTVIHNAENRSGADKEVSIWALTVTDKGGRELFEMNDNDAGWLYNRNMTIWHYTDLSDRERLGIGKRYLTFTQVSKEGKMKIGLNLDKGYSVCVNKGNAFIKTFKTDKDGIYPDNNCSFETFTDGNILEIESLSPLYNVENGKSISHTEVWQLIKADYSGNIFANETDASVFIGKLKNSGIL